MTVTPPAPCTVTGKPALAVVDDVPACRTGAAAGQRHGHHRKDPGEPGSRTYEHKKTSALGGGIVSSPDLVA